MKLRGTTSVLAAAVAVGLVAMVGASSEEQVIEAVPAPAVVKSPPAPAPGIGHARNAMREAFGEDFADPLGVYSMTGGYETWVVPGDEDLGFDPYNAPTPEVIQPDGQEALQPVVVPLPLAPASIPVTTVESVGREKPGALLSQPVRGRSSSKFGMRFHPVLRVYKLHTGHDWAAPCGTAVGAAAAGTVVGTGWAGGNGVQVKIDHGTLGGYRVVTTYNHLSSIGVKVGQKVSALQGVGRVGSTGYSTGCHLHFEVIVNGQFTDPIPWLNGKPGIVDLSKMMSVVPTGPSSPGLSPSASPSVTGSPTAGQSPSRGTTEPPAAPEPGDTSAAGPGPSRPPTGTDTNPPAAPEPGTGPVDLPSVPGTSPSPSPTKSTTSPAPSPSVAPTTKPPSPSPSPTPTQSPTPSASPSPSPSPSPSTSPSEPPSPVQTMTESLSAAPESPSAEPSPSPTVVESA